MHSPENGGRRPERKIGEILIEQGRISREQLDEALAVQKTEKKYIGKILVSLGYLAEEELARALSVRLSVEYVRPVDIRVDPEVVGIISEDVLIQHKAVPIRIDGGRLIVAMSDPNDIHARSDLTISAGYPITPVIAAEGALRSLQRQLFGGDQMQGAVAELTGAVEATRAAEAEPGT